MLLTKVFSVNYTLDLFVIQILYSYFAVVITTIILFFIASHDSAISLPSIISYLSYL